MAIIILMLFIVMAWYEYNFIFKKRLKLNAHALGKYKEKLYPNCREAFLNSYYNGFRYFEVDVSITSDNKLVISHETKKVCTETFHQFLKSGNSDRTPLSLNDVFDFMKVHSEIIVMFDFLPGYYSHDIPDEINLFCQAVVNSGVQERCIIEIYSDCNVKYAKKYAIDNLQMWIEPREKRSAPYSDIDDYISFMKKENIRIVSISKGDVIRHPIDVIKLHKNKFQIYSAVWDNLLQLWLYPQTRMIDYITTDLLIQNNVNKLE